jgi:hypothetical protein
MSQIDAALSEALLGFAHTLSNGQDVGDVVRDLSGKLANALDIDGPGVCLLDGGAVHLVSRAGELIPVPRPNHKDEASTPVESAGTGRLVLVRRVEDETVDWPSCAAKIAALGFAPAASVSIDEAGPVAVIEVYARPERQWSSGELAVVSLFAEVATAFLQQASELERERRTVEQLQTALSSRIIIEQAKGMVAAQHNVTVDRAFALLRKHANDHNASLHSVAEAVVNLGLRLSAK